MRKAVIDQIILWIVLFVSFISIFFITIDYSMVIKIKDKSDALSSYGARTKALGEDDSDIIQGLNNVKGDFFDTISDENLTCEELATSNYQVIFTTNISFNNRFLSDGKKIYSTSSAFNEINSTDQNCSLNLSVQ